MITSLCPVAILTGIPASDADLRCFRLKRIRKTACKAYQKRRLKSNTGLILSISHQWVRLPVVSLTFGRAEVNNQLRNIVLIDVGATGFARRFYRFFVPLADLDFALTFARILDNVASCFVLLLAASFAMLLFKAANSFRRVAT